MRDEEYGRQDKERASLYALQEQNRALQVKLEAASSHLTPIVTPL